MRANDAALVAREQLDAARYHLTEVIARYYGPTRSDGSIACVSSFLRGGLGRWQLSAQFEPGFVNRRKLFTLCAALLRTVQLILLHPHGAPRFTRTGEEHRLKGTPEPTSATFGALVDCPAAPSRYDRGVGVASLP